ncbi:GNAT family N-acetyltransferase [Xylophilus ampelinus]
MPSRRRIHPPWWRCDRPAAWCGPGNIRSKYIARKQVVQPGMFLVAEQAGTIVGSAMVVGYDGHRGWVYYLAVAPAERAKAPGGAFAG